MKIIDKVKLRLKLKLFPNNLSSKEYIVYLKSKGIQVGKGTIFYAPSLWTVDIQRPWLIEIGEYCKITRGVVILTHDYSRSVLRRAYGDISAEAKKTTIGNNVIIGAGSVVSGIIPDNVVVAGNPAKVIRSLDEHYNIRKVCQ